MTSESSAPPANAAGVLQNTDPFESDQSGPAATDDQIGSDEEGLRLVGVRSANPFATEESTTSGVDAGAGYDPGPPSAVSPGPDTPIAGDLARKLTSNPDITERDADVQPSPGGVKFDNIDPFDHAAGHANEQASAGAAEAEEGDFDGDRADRGTDIFAIAEPLHADKEAESSQSGRDSDSDGGPKPHVAFAGADQVEQVPTKEDDDNSPDLLNKIKSTVSNVKDKIHLDNVLATGPFKKMNPTSVKMNVRFGDEPENVGIIWRSRDNRKGRNSIVVPRASMAYPNLPVKNRPVYSSSFKGVWRNLYRMVFTFPYWDMAFWSGWSYTWGSVLFVIDSVWAWIPVGWKVNLGGIETYGVGLLFFFGALLYQLGATMAYLEAVNDGSFHGSAMKRFLEGHEDDKKQLLDEKIHNFFGHLHPLHSKRQHAQDEEEEKRHRSVDPEAGWKTLHRRERPGSIYPGSKMPAPRRGGVDLGEAEEGETHEYLTWRWWPTWEALRTHHVYEIGYLACSIQLFGATLYTWCGLDSLPGISTRFNDTQWYAAYYMPEMLGSTCFLTASLMFLVETQERWWKIQPNVVGWWIGFWAMVGSLGFLFIGIFGTIDQATGAHWAEYQSECSSTWGSFAYLLSSLCQWYEAVNKHPIEELLSEPGEMKSYQVR